MQRAFSASSCAMILRRLASSPQLAMTTRCAVRPLLLPAASMRFTTAMPSTTLPNTTAASNVHCSAIGLPCLEDLLVASY